MVQKKKIAERDLGDVGCCASWEPTVTASH